MKKEIQDRIDEWSRPPFDDDTVREIQELVDSNNEKELTERFYTTLEFGTGGLRGIMGSGTNRMNIYTVGMATQGLASYIKKKGEPAKGVVIAYDSRNMSDIFSRDAAAILAGNGITVYLFDDISPTPLCSFAIRELGCVSGIVITASHNPPAYNGYKVYWDDGGQVVSPQDSEIINEVRGIDNISKIQKMDFDDACGKGLIKIIGDDILKSYISRLEQTALRRKGESKLKIVYSPLHGTGYRIIPEVLNHFGFSGVSIVESQGKPDGDFPTVDYPNPEERDAMQLSIELAQKTGADLIMATDPDADRMGVGFKDEKGNYQLITGNQIGTMLEYYLLKRLKAENKLPDNGTVIKTIVTTDLQERIAKAFNCNIENVLTGFKWIALKMAGYDSDGSQKFIFGGEESYGYLPVDFVRDKDAISSCYFFAEMADWLKENNSSLNEFLNEIFCNFGLFQEDLHSLTMKGQEGMESIKNIMKAFRNAPPESFAGIKVARIDDIQDLKRINCAEKTESAIEGLPKSNVLQYFLDDTSKVTIRPSGTEPKIKFYFSVNREVTADDLEDARNSLKEKIELLKNDLLGKIEKIPG